MGNQDDCATKWPISKKGAGSSLLMYNYNLKGLEVEDHEKVGHCLILTVAHRRILIS